MAEERIGLTVGGVIEGRPLADLADYAQTAEAAGYETLLMPEAWGRDALLSLTYLATQTSRIKLGTGIINVFSRSAAVVAMAAATLDEVSGGRALLGLGVSGRRVIEGWHGIPMEKPLSRLREYVQVVQKVLRRDRSRFAGQVLQLAPGFALRTKPVRSEVPIWLATMGPQAVRLTGEVADGWLPYLVPHYRLAEEVALLQEGLDKAGRPRSACTVAPYILAAVHNDLAVATLALKRHIAFYVGGMGEYYHAAVSRHGFQTAADQVKAEWEAGRRDAATAAVPDELVDAIALAGPAERCRARLADFRAEGADVPIIGVPAELGPEGFKATIGALGPGAK